MEKKERYPDAQKKFLKLKPESLTAEEKEMLRVLMLPRNHYFPDTEEECEDLAREILKGESYAHFADFRALLFEKYGDAGEWCRGIKDVILFCRFRKGGKSLCSVALRADDPELVITLGEKECRAFDEIRDGFPRDGILWVYDNFAGAGKQKTLRYDLSERRLWQYYLRIIGLKAR